jgi:CubicO group peptidase (beta-lactamase class C family)
MIRTFPLHALLPALFLLPLTGEESRKPGVLDFSREQSVRESLRAATDRRVIPGAVFWIEREGQAMHGAIGRRAVLPKKEAMSGDTIFDLASLTKVTATTPAVMLLVEKGAVKLEARVSDYLPEFTGEGRERITVRHLLTHTSGLKPSLSVKEPWLGYDTGIGLACASLPEHAPDEQFRYSDINFILLGEIVRRAGGAPLDEFTKKRVFGPMRMRDTTFNPDAKLRGRIAPTERDESGQMLRGVVHDPTSRRMGGVAGHAGLFSTAADLARYCRMLLNGGELDGVRLFQPETVRLMTSVETPPALPDRRGLGWDIDTRYSRPRGALFPIGSFGHTGFTGTCYWVDPFSRTFFVFLSSRLHATDPKTDSRQVYEDMGTQAALCVLNFDFNDVSGALKATERTLK